METLCVCVEGEKNGKHGTAPPASLAPCTDLPSLLPPLPQPGPAVPDLVFDADDEAAHLEASLTTLHVGGATVRTALQSPPPTLAARARSRSSRRPRPRRASPCPPP